MHKRKKSNEFIEKIIFNTLKSGVVLSLQQQSD